MSAAAAGTPGSDLAQAEDYSSLEIISDSDSDDWFLTFDDYLTFLCSVLFTCNSVFKVFQLTELKLKRVVSFLKCFRFSQSELL